MDASLRYCGTLLDLRASCVSPNLSSRKAVPSSLRSHCSPASLPPRRHSVLAPRAARPSPPDLAQLVQEKNASEPVVVYSKTWCPYCSQVKGLFKRLGVEATVLELDEFVEGDGIQSALLDLTGQRTVPNVFIGGKHIGGCDDTVELHRRGELAKLLADAGVTIQS